MIISAILIAALLACALYGFFNATRSRTLRTFTVGLSLLGIVFVLTPELTTRLAHFLGVGRGADLLLYCWVVLSLAIMLQMQMGFVRMGEQMTEIARAIAIAAPSWPHGPPDEAAGANPDAPATLAGMPSRPTPD